MNSDEERALFEGCGWEYDYIAREWVSSDGKRRVSIDSVMEVTSEGPEGEERLRALVKSGCRGG